MRRTTTTAALLALAAGTLLAGPARAQDAGEIIEDALEAYAESVEGIDDYTVTYDGFMGQGSLTTYYEKEIVDGYPVFRPVDVQGVDTGEGFNPYTRFPELAERAEYGGAETIDGVGTHRVVIDDLEGLDLAPPTGEGAEFRPDAMTMWIDDDGLIRRMRMEGTTTAGGEAKPITVDVHLGDYRTVEGMPYPFEMAIAVEGAVAASGMSEQELAEARRNLERLREQIEAMPESQQEQMRGILGPQLEQLESMVGAGAFEMTMTVRDLKVNTGPPSES